MSAQSELDANAILARVESGLRAHERPAYVAYTIDRRDSVEGIPDLVNSYRLRLWCRTADNAALARHVWGSHASGEAMFVRPAFDAPIDPGPPTADILEVFAARKAASTPAPAASTPAASVIGSVAVYIETNYHVTYAGTERDDDHLKLEARRDSDRYRLTDLYVDRLTYALHRAVAHDHLYEEGRTVPERFEIVFGEHDGVPVIVSIHGQIDYDAPAARESEPLHEVDYRFEDIAFPATMPDWYFEPREYGAHRTDFP